jgi:cell division protein FtsW
VLFRSITLIAVLTLMVLSLGVVYSAGSSWMAQKGRSSDTLLGSHAAKVLLSFLALFLFMQIDYKIYRKISKPALLVAVGLLGLTLAFGGEVKGAARWISLGGVGFQPSEFAKFALLFHLATLIVQKGDQIRDFKTGFAPLAFWVGIVTALVLMQPNFSTGAMIVALSFVMLYVGRVRLTHIALSFAAALPVLAVYVLSAEYRMRRIMGFLQGEGGGNGGATYQLTQGIIGFGNGGILGLGPGGSRQRDLFLPESYGDFVFSIVGEEYGLVGTVFIILLFMVIMLRGIKIARHAPDRFGSLLAVGITSTIVLYALVNAGVTLGVLPTTGLPMPFVSYGGTSMLFSAAAVGVLLNISSQTDLHPRLSSGVHVAQVLEPRQAAVGKVY